MSPGVEIKEKDYSSIVPSVAIGNGAIVGRFASGPINVPVMISTEDQLFNVFGAPNEANFTEWLTAAQFLSYASSLWVVRAKPTDVANAHAGTGTVTILNDTEYYDSTNGFTAAERTSAKEWVAKSAGVEGNHIGVFMVDADSMAGFKTWAELDDNKALFPSNMPLSSYFSYTPGTTDYMKNKAADPTENKKDELHILVVDVDGFITGKRWNVLEKYQGLSKCIDATDYKGNSLYYANVINQASKYIWFGTHTTNVTAVADVDMAWGSASSVVAPDGKVFAAIDITDDWTINTVTVHFPFKQLAGGVAGTLPGDSEITAAYNMLANKDLYEANLFMTAAYSTSVVQSVVNVVTARKDGLAFISPRASGATPAPIFDTSATAVTEILSSITTFQISETDGQYCVADTGWKYVFDRYNGLYRWIPLNGDIAGITARNDVIVDPWWSPAGFNRGGLKNVIKLAYNPSQSDRDVLYPKGVNPVVAFPGQGVVLFGDRTLTQKPSAFDRINVRRLFIILEKSISIAAKYQLFEFNDSFTRAQFKGMIEPFLRQIKGGRGITDFLVICDSSNNPGQVIDSNQFVADIYVKPTRSINYITLNFIATRSEVEFSTQIANQQ